MGSSRYQVYSSSGNGLNIEIQDFFSPKLSELINDRTRYSLALRASRHVAYETQREMKILLNSGLGGDALKRVRDPSIVRSLRAAGGNYVYRHHGTNNKPFASNRQKNNSKSRMLARAIGYQQRSDGSVAGWLSSSAQMLGGAVQAGRRGRNLFSGGDMAPQVITKKMQRYFAALGFYGEKKRTIGKKPYLRKPRPSGNTSRQIDQEKRPFINNYYREHLPRIQNMFRDRFYLKLEETLTRKFA